MHIDPKRERSTVPQDQQWDLSTLYASPQAWEDDFQKLKEHVHSLKQYAGKLSQSPEVLRDCLRLSFEFDEMAERLAYYAFLRVAEDLGSSESQARQGRFTQLETERDAVNAFLRPEIQNIPSDALQAWLQRDDFADFRVFLNKLLRFKPHILSEAEERILALQAESAQTAQKTFSALVDVDLEFGSIDTPDGPRPLTNSTFSSFLQNPDRNIRQSAYHQYYSVLTSHKNSIANLYAGSIQQDVYRAKVRNFGSSLEAALFPDNVDPNVYRNLIQTVHDHLPILHSYYGLRKTVLGISDYSHFDNSVPLVKDVKMHHSYEQAVDMVVRALEPLGEEYCSTIQSGLLGKDSAAWVDRYENKGKRSGAFSAGSFHGAPYILMNYKEDLLRDVFTLAHEGGHSMHSWYSSRNNPYPHYSYTIFEAEVASTFNEQLLFRSMLSQTEDKTLRTYLLNKQIDDMIGTIFRQTMFAEFELRCHEMVEGGQALTVDVFRSEYRKLLEQYFGPDVTLPEVADMEGLRIPHFYRAFYVYKYATGLSAAIALSKRVLHEGEPARNDYFKFLKSGGSRFPIESLAIAGVDMSTPEPISQAMNNFKSVLDELRALIV